MPSTRIIKDRRKYSSICTTSVDRTCAGALDHIGILFSSVNNPNRSSADAINLPSTFTVAVLIFVLAGAALASTGTGAPARGDCFEAGAAGFGGTGVPVRESSGVALTIKSFPCVSKSACANSLNLASNNAGNWALASL